jgi:hypothetical protein
MAYFALFYEAVDHFIVRRATSATTAARFANSSTSISTKKTSVFSAVNPAPSRKAIASSSFPRLPAVANRGRSRR